MSQLQEEAERKGLISGNDQKNLIEKSMDKRNKSIKLPPKPFRNRGLVHDKC